MPQSRFRIIHGDSAQVFIKAFARDSDTFVTRTIRGSDRDDTHEKCTPTS
jgi:hypothetical protein